MTILPSLQCWPLLQSATLIDFVCFVLASADRSFPEPYADLPYCPDDRALRRHIHSIPPQNIELAHCLACVNQSEGGGEKGEDADLHSGELRTGSSGAVLVLSRERNCWQMER